ncbi:MAG TPA: NAD(+)/NADH kinase [Candidatus Coprenecus pullistercoris]|nr:NAD(+)/NADH kinase [Candidatus Coprenecus pullistercoris]
MHFALYGRNIGPDAGKRMAALVGHLINKGVRLSLFVDLVEALQAAGLTELPCGRFSSGCDLPEDVDVFLSLGGDGTFLSSLTMVKDREIPVAGVNFGRLGFLTSAGSPDAGCSLVDRIVAGDYSVESRSLLRMSYEGLPEDFYPYALNEISMQRVGPNMIGIEVAIDGMRIPTYWADGLLIATPTGSTAYSLSVGGPVVVPGSSVFIITPMSPHNLNVRPLIVPDTSVVDVTIKSAGRRTVLSADNRSADMLGGWTVRVSKAPFPLKCVTFGRNGFFEALNEKLLWGEDRRNDRAVYGRDIKLI